MTNVQYKQILLRLICFVLVLSVVGPMVTPVFAFNIANSELASPGSKVSTPGEHYYTLKNLPLGTAVQDFAIGGDYIYVTQRTSSTSGDIYISKCKINRNMSVPYDATRESYMTITNAGYGESLDIFTYNGTTYLLTGLYAQATDKWSLQIGRVAYSAGKTYAYSDIRRFKSMEHSGLRSDESVYAVSLAKLNGTIDRVNACVGDTYTVFRVQMSVSRSGENKCGIFYSYFNTNSLFALLDSGSYDFDNGSASASAHRTAHVDTFYQAEENNNLVLPNKGFQGMEATDGKNIYVAGGNDGESPKIARMNGSTYANLCTISNIGNVEIQGLHYEGHHLYFSSTTGGDANNRNWQKIYRASTCIAGYGSHTSANKTGYAATCTVAGRTDGTYCTRCGDILSGYTVLNPLGHAATNIPAVAATCTQTGLTQGSYCSRSGCGITLTAQTTTEALGHSFNNGTITRNPSGMTDGIMTIACTRNDHSFTVPIPSVNVPVSFAKPMHSNLLKEVSYKNSTTNVTGTQVSNVAYADAADTSVLTAELYDSRRSNTPDGLLLKPTQLLSKIVRLNTTVSANVSYSTSGKEYNIPVTMSVPIQVVPATSVYYEAEDLSIITTSVKNGTAWQRKTSFVQDIHDSYAVNIQKPINESADVYFDFKNTAEDQDRYSDSRYGGRNYDEPYWVTHYVDDNSTVYDNKFEIDHDEGTMTLRVGYGYSGSAGGRMYGPEVYVSQQNGQPHYLNPALNYTVPDDGVQRYFQIRFKTIDCVYDNFEDNDASPYAILRCGFYDSPTASYKLENEVYSHIQYTIHNDEYITLTAPLSAKFTGWLGFVGVRFRSIRPIEGKEATARVVIDYIYVGTEEGLPTLNEVQNTNLIDKDPTDTTNALFFDFENTTQDQQRYAQETYKGTNYDVKGNWTTHYVNGSAWDSDYTIDNENGTLNMAVRDGSSTTQYGPEIFTVLVPNENAHNQEPSLQFNPSGAQYLYIRFKVTNCKFDKYNGTETSPKFILRYYYWNGSAYKEDTIAQDFTLIHNQYITLRLPLSSTFMSATTIGRIGMRFRNLVQASEEGGSIEIDYIYIGTDEDAPKRAGDNYGYDASYADDESLSDARSLYVLGAGVPNMQSAGTDSAGNTLYTINYNSASAYTEASFDFTGTGLDIIGRTGAKQAALRVVICDQSGIAKENVTVICKGNSELYQIPIVSIRNLTYGTYTVHIFVNAPFDFGDDKDADDFGGALDRGGEFYFDAIRIYEPMNTSAADTDSQYAYGLHQNQGEAAPEFREIRKILIDATNFKVGEIEGAVYIDATASKNAIFDDENGKLQANVAEYKAIGPNNEVYLKPGMAIAFKLVADGTLPISVDLGAKSADGKAATMSVGVYTDAPTSLPTNQMTIATCTPLYYPLNIFATNYKNNAVYIVICNSGTEGILSLTDIKLAYDISSPKKSAKFMIDANLLAAMNICVSHNPTYENLGTEHRMICENCEAYTETHSYVNGLCICGAEEVSEPESVFDENLSILMSVSVGAEMQVGYTVAGAKVASYDSFYLEVIKEVAGGEPVKTIFSLDAQNLVVKTRTTGEIAGYLATYTGIVASEMGDNFTATLYAVTADGTLCYGESVTASIKSYLTEKLNDASSSAELKTLAVDMLNYGAAAQLYFNYDTENLVNAELTEAQRALGTQTIAEAENASAVSGYGAKLLADVSLQSKVVLYLTCQYAADADSDLKFVVKDINGNILDAFAPNTIHSSVCRGSYSNVGAKQMRSLLVIELHDCDTLVSQSLIWSVESYVAATRENGSDALVNIANAMLVYGDSAAAYLASMN